MVRYDFTLDRTPKSRVFRLTMIALTNFDTIYKLDLLPSPLSRRQSLLERGWGRGCYGFKATGLTPYPQTLRNPQRNPPYPLFGESVNCVRNRRANWPQRRLPDTAGVIVIFQ